jgi:hypothetical protein
MENLHKKYKKTTAKAKKVKKEGGFFLKLKQEAGSDHIKGKAGMLHTNAGYPHCCE